jgi:predicted ATPase
MANEIEVENTAAIRSKEQMEATINRIMEANKSNKEALDIASHAIEILREVSDEAVSQAYSFLESSLNAALERMFANTTRKIEIKEYIRNNQYPQLELVLHVGNGKTRSLKSDSGHGLAQIVSLLSILSLIVITGSRRILVMDEIISGLSVHNREVVADILWSFTEIGFQFIVNDHGFIIPNSHVYHLEMNGDVSTVKKHYIATKGVYLQGESGKVYDYEDKVATEQPEDTEEIEEYPEQEQVQPIKESGGVVADMSTGDNVLSI